MNLITSNGQQKKKSNGKINPEIDMRHIQSMDVWNSQWQAQRQVYSQGTQVK